MSNLPIYKDCRRKQNPLDSLYYVIYEQEKVHPDLMKGFSSNNREVLFSVIRAARSLDYFIKSLPKIKEAAPSSEVWDSLTDQSEALFEYIALFVGEDVMIEFAIDTNNA